MKHLHYFLKLFTISFCASAQDSGCLFSKPIADSTKINPGFTIGIAPLAIIDIFDASSLRVSAEVPLGKRIDVGTESGFIFFESMYKYHARGFVIKPEVKFYLNPKKNVMRYFALEYMYKEQHYYLTDSLKDNGVRYEKKI